MPPVRYPSPAIFLWYNQISGHTTSCYTSLQDSNTFIGDKRQGHKKKNKPLKIINASYFQDYELKIFLKLYIEKNALLA